jgi:hypothetical protein
VELVRVEEKVCCGGFVVVGGCYGGERRLLGW